jgi:hypothetical protein
MPHFMPPVYGRSRRRARRAAFIADLHRLVEVGERR